MPVTPSDTRTAVAAIEMLARPGELFMLVVDDHGKPRCQPWTIEPDQHRIVTSERDGSHAVKTMLTFHIAGTEIVLESMEIAADDGWSTSCPERRLAVYETDDAIVARGSKWFRTASGCAGAIAHHARVATDLDCSLDRSLESGNPESRRKFETMLRRGGTMYAISDGPHGDFCQAVTLEPYTQQAHAGSVEGNMSYPIVLDGVHGIETYGYEMQLGSDQLALLGPSQEMEDGIRMGMLCGGENAVEFRPDAVELQGALYFTATRCRTAVSEAKAKASWMPAEPQDEVASAPTAEDRARARDISGPALGGC